MPEYVFSLTRIRGKSEILSIDEKKTCQTKPIFWCILRRKPSGRKYQIIKPSVTKWLPLFFALYSIRF